MPATDLPPSRHHPTWFNGHIMVYRSGWWPSLAYHLETLAQYLSQLPIDSPLQPVSQLELIRQQGSALQFVTEAIKVVVEFDGTYTLITADSSVSMAADRLAEFEEHIWLPELQQLLPTQISLPAASPMEIVVWVPSEQPALLSLPASFGPATQLAADDQLATFTTQTHVFVASPELSDDSEAVLQHWLWRQTIQRSHQQLQSAVEQSQARLDLLAQPWVRAAQLGQFRRQLAQHQLTLLQLKQLVDQLGSTVERLVSIVDSQTLAFESEAVTTQTYLEQTIEYQQAALEQLALNLQHVTDQARQRQWFYLSTLLCTVGVAVVLDWMRAVALPDLSLSWFGSLLALAIFTICIQSLYYFLSQRWMYRLTKPQGTDKAQERSKKQSAKAEQEMETKGPKA